LLKKKPSEKEGFYIVIVKVVIITILQIPLLKEPFLLQS
jgi:hypothetical protein